MNIEKMLMCPECGHDILTTEAQSRLCCDLPAQAGQLRTMSRAEGEDKLKCVQCGIEYGFRYGVYDMVSPKLSGNQEILWRFTDEDIEREESPESADNDWREDYRSRLSEETKYAQQKQDIFMEALVESFFGAVCDLATGLGSSLNRLLSAKTKSFHIVCTDIDRRVLAMTRKNRKTDDMRVSYIATDGRYMSIKNDSFDFITSVAAFGNIPESDKVAKEMYRILKPGGKMVVEGSYVDKDSRSFELAKSVGIEKGMVEELLVQELKNAGFQKVESTIVAKAVWAENPYDLLPVAGDMQYFCVIQAEK